MQLAFGPRVRNAFGELMIQRIIKILIKFESDMRSNCVIHTLEIS